MKKTRLFALLDEYVTTPDAMAIAPDGELVLSCPNYADQSVPGCLVRFSLDGKARKWVDVPVHPETNLGSPMGIEFGPDGDLYVCDNQGWPNKEELRFKGRILRLRIEDDKVVKTTVVANGMEHPNGIRIRNGYAYVTQSHLHKVKDPTGLLRSCVYRFPLDGENIQVHNTLEDEHIIYSTLTRNPACQYGLDGIVFDLDGNLLVGNFGDGAVIRLYLDADGKVVKDEIFAQNPEELKSTDGMIMDELGNLYIADFSANAIGRVSPDGTVKRIAQSPDTDGFNGELDQPGEPCIWNGKLVVTCFDLVTDDYNVNTAHELPATMCYLPMEEAQA